MTGFEPAAPSSRTKCATKLRYIPMVRLYGIAHPQQKGAGQTSGSGRFLELNTSPCRVLGP
jgi:hypothetical protein